MWLKNSRGYRQKHNEKKDGNQSEDEDNRNEDDDYDDLNTVD